MKKAFISLFISTLFLNLILCQERYDVSNISKELMSNADAVVRTDQEVFNVSSIENATGKRKFAITIINEEADNYRYVSIEYNSFITPKNIIASYYDEKGKLIDYISSQYIYDFAANYSSMLVTDERMKCFAFPKYKLPYTIEFQYDVAYKGLLFYPTKKFQPSKKISVEESSIEFVIPKELPLRRLEKNLSSHVDSVINKKNIIYSWREENLKAYRDEPFSESFDRRVPKLITAPSKFKMGGYTGDLSSWKSFGLWINSLNANLGNISPEFSNKLKEMVKDIPDEKEKVITLYKYFQSITRYFSVSLGIGGWQPTAASEVEKTGFGECKSLTNFMKSMLASIGVNSYYTIANSGEDNDIFKEFPSQQFDHVFLFVPLKEDTLWLECTSQTNPAGFLGSFTDNRNVLIISDEGGKIVHTPFYNEKQNVISSKTNVDIDIIGYAKAKMNLTFYGKAYDYVSDFDEIGKYDMEKQLNKYIGIPSFIIEKSDYSKINDILPTGKVNLSLQLLNFCSKTHSRLIFNLNIINKFPYIPEKKTDFYINESKTTLDTVIFNIPYGYLPEFIPKELIINTNFGNFKGKIEYADSKLYYCRTLILHRGNYFSKDHNVADFINKIANFDRLKIVFMNPLYAEEEKRDIN